MRSGPRDRGRGIRAEGRVRDWETGSGPWNGVRTKERRFTDEDLRRRRFADEDLRRRRHAQMKKCPDEEIADEEMRRRRNVETKKFEDEEMRAKICETKKCGTKICPVTPQITPLSTKSMHGRGGVLQLDRHPNLT